MSKEIKIMRNEVFIDFLVFLVNLITFFCVFSFSISV